MFAIVCKVMWNPNSKTGEQFGYKDMDESMGPCEANCPQHVLALLTPTEREHAIDWRHRCAANLELRGRKLEDGDRVKLAVPVTFTDGHTGDEFIVEKRGRRLCLRDPGAGGRYRISRFMELQWTIARATKVHQTLFA